MNNLKFQINHETLHVLLEIEEEKISQGKLGFSGLYVLKPFSAQNRS